MIEITTNKQLCLNLGCGNDYKEGWLNCDFNKDNKIDLYCDLTAETLPWADNSVDRILMDNVLEHIPRERYFHFMDELWRICKHGAMIEIYVPHCTSPFAFGNPAHYNFFHSHSMSVMDVKVPCSYERYNSARFNIKATILPFHHNYFHFHFLSGLNKFTAWIFNISPTWQMICEKITPWGFEEVHYQLEVVKC